MRAPSLSSALALALTVVLAGAGCASAGNSDRAPGATANRIVHAEFSPLGQIDALSAIQRLRPRWFQARSGSGPVLYVDGNRRNSVEELSFISADELEGADFMSASDATTRFGTGHVGGAIMVSMIH
jgi:hypothetical protein